MDDDANQLLFVDIYSVVLSVCRLAVIDKHVKTAQRHASFESRAVRS